MWHLIKDAAFRDNPPNPARMPTTRQIFFLGHRGSRRPMRLREMTPPAPTRICLRRYRFEGILIGKFMT